MPYWISKEEAHQRITSEKGEQPCALCALCVPSKPRRLLLRETRHCVALLARYARQWGHAMILLRRHVTTYREVSPEEWSETNQLALQIAQRIEAALSPVRCYIASLGAATEHPMTFPHLHVHVIPVYQSTDTPSSILTTAHGVLTASDEEFDALLSQLRID
jgi:diadenosine tetraphosphate (Ap4A) HIT family hydrolase